MSEPIVFISTHRIKEGKHDAFKEQYREAAKRIEAEKPETVAFLAYLDEDETEVSTVHVFPDAEAMERHMEGAGKRTKEAAEFLEFQSFEIYGSPSDQVLEMMQQATGSETSLNITPQFVNGYLRLQSA